MKQDPRGPSDHFPGVYNRQWFTNMPIFVLSCSPTENTLQCVFVQGYRYVFVCVGTCQYLVCLHTFAYIFCVQLNTIVYFYIYFYVYFCIPCHDWVFLYIVLYLFLYSLLCLCISGYTFMFIFEYRDMIVYFWIYFYVYFWILWHDCVFVYTPIMSIIVCTVIVMCASVCLFTCVFSTPLCIVSQYSLTSTVSLGTFMR